MLSCSKKYSINDIMNLMAVTSTLLFLNKEYVLSRHDKSKVLSRSSSMWICLLPYFSSKAFVKKIFVGEKPGTNDGILKNLEQYLQVSIAKDAQWACNCIISYFMFKIPWNTFCAEDDSFKEIVFDKHFRVTDNALMILLHRHQIDVELCSGINKIMNRGRKEDSIDVFTGFLSLKYLGRSNPNVIYRAIENGVYEKFINKFTNHHFDVHYSILISFL